MKYSTNKKLNAILNSIETMLLHILDTEEESLNEIRHYMKGYPYEEDYNIYQSGTAEFRTWEIRQMYLQAGYKAEKWSFKQLEEAYKRQIGYVARQLTNR